MIRFDTAHYAKPNEATVNMTKIVQERIIAEVVNWISIHVDELQSSEPGTLLKQCQCACKHKVKQECRPIRGPIAGCLFMNEGQL